jgi:hypothetical protein
MMNTNFEKYLKYKNKYLDLKTELQGGAFIEPLPDDEPAAGAVRPPAVVRPAAGAAGGPSPAGAAGGPSPAGAAGSQSPGKPGALERFYKGMKWSGAPKARIENAPVAPASQPSNISNDCKECFELKTEIENKLTKIIGSKSTIIDMLNEVDKELVQLQKDKNKIEKELQQLKNKNQTTSVVSSNTESDTEIMYDIMNLISTGEFNKAQQKLNDNAKKLNTGDYDYLTNLIIQYRQK